MNRTPSTATVKPLLAFASVMSALTIAAAQNSQQQRFRAGVDLITVHVAAVDARGRSKTSVLATLP